MASDNRLVVVGGGPAGFSAAIGAPRGFEVIVLEQRSASQQTPGETLHPGIEALFTKMGMRDDLHGAGFHRHEGVWVTWNEPRRFERYGSDRNGPWLGFQAPRQVLNDLLRRAALRYGVKVLRGCKAIGLIERRGRITAVQSTHGTLNTRWTLDASGCRHWLAKEFGLPLTHCGPRLYVAFGWKSVHNQKQEINPSLAATADGWKWSAPLGDGVQGWCQLRLNTQTESQTKSHCASMRDVSWRCVARMADTGYFLLGDAAAVVDPASSHGVLKGMMSGLLAGFLIEAVSTDRMPEDDAYAAYRTWIMSYFRHDVARLGQFYAPSIESFRRTLL